MVTEVERALAEHQDTHSTEEYLRTIVRLQYSDAVSDVPPVVRAARRLRAAAQHAEHYEDRQWLKRFADWVERPTPWTNTREVARALLHDQPLNAEKGPDPTAPGGRETR